MSDPRIYDPLTDSRVDEEDLDARAVCEFCGRVIEELESGFWVDVISGDWGGVYDICEEHSLADARDGLGYEPKGHSPRIEPPR